MMLPLLVGFALFAELAARSPRRIVEHTLDTSNAEDSGVLLRRELPDHAQTRNVALDGEDLEGELAALAEVADPESDASAAANRASQVLDNKNLSEAEKVAIEAIVKEKILRKMENVNTSRLIKILMVGFTVLIMTGFYLMHWQEIDRMGNTSIETMTWRVLADSLGMFLGIVVFFMLQDWITIAAVGDNGFNEFGLRKPIEAENGDLIPVWLCVLDVTMLYLSFQLCLWKRLKWLAIVIGHVMAFAAAEMFGTVQTRKPFSDSILLGAMVLPTVFFLGLLYRFFGDLFRRRVGDNTPESKAWARQCRNAEDRYFAFTVGMLICQLCRFGIEGKLPPVFGYATAIDLKVGQIFGLFMVSFAFGIISTMLFYLRKYLRPRGFEKTLLLSSQQIATMAMAWCLYFSCKLEYYHSNRDRKLGGSADAKLVSDVWNDIEASEMAFMFTFIGISMIIVSDLVSSQNPLLGGMGQLHPGFVLLIGLSWQKAFTLAISKNDLSSDLLHQLFHKTQTSMTLIFFITPAWAMLILPKAEQKQKMKRHQELRHAVDNANKEALESLQSIPTDESSGSDTEEQPNASATKSEGGGSGGSEAIGASALGGAEGGGNGPNAPSAASSQPSPPAISSKQAGGAAAAPAVASAGRGANPTPAAAPAAAPSVPVPATVEDKGESTDDNMDI